MKSPQMNKLFPLAITVLALYSPALIAEELNAVPQHLLGNWLEQLSTRDYNALCRPGRIQVFPRAIVEFPKDCGEGRRSQSRFLVRTILKEEAWLSNKVTYGLIGNFTGLDSTFSWVFETREGSGEAYIYVTDPTESGSRRIGTFRKQF